MKEIKLTQGKVALVDDEDFDFLNQWKWHAYKSKGCFYARRYDCANNSKRPIRIHNLLVKVCDGELVDHKDGNGLNNQRSNLRSCTKRQNAINRKGWGSSKYTGVSFDKGSGKWRSRINFGSGNKNLGRFKSEENAAIAYNIFAEKHHGEFARYNTATT